MNLLIYIVENIDTKYFNKEEEEEEEEDNERFHDKHITSIPVRFDLSADFFLEICLLWHKIRILLLRGKIWSVFPYNWYFKFHDI